MATEATPATTTTAPAGTAPETGTQPPLDLDAMILEAIVTSEGQKMAFKMAKSFTSDEPIAVFG
jgi:hypothetical protein